MQPHLIKLNKGYTLVSEQDYDYLNQWKWHVSSRGYAVRSIKSFDESGIHNHTISMHREVLKRYELLTNPVVDHINHNKLDNRRENLRQCSVSQNLGNSVKTIANTSGYKGVHRTNSKAERWGAVLIHQKKRYYLGAFKDKMDAVRAYDEKSKELFGSFAFNNSMIGNK